MEASEKATTAAVVRAMAEQEVDWGSIKYLRNSLTLEVIQVANSHCNVATQAMCCIGNGDEQSSGMCFAHGPPGTGKNTTIITILGAILHHSFHGLVRRAQHPSIPAQPDKLKCACEGVPLRVLWGITYSNE